MDALVNLTGFSLVGGPASQDAKKAKLETLRGVFQIDII